MELILCPFRGAPARWCTQYDKTSQRSTHLPACSGVPGRRQVGERRNVARRGKYTYCRDCARIFQGARIALTCYI